MTSSLGIVFLRRLTGKIVVGALQAGSAEDFLFEVGETGLRLRVAQLGLDGVHLRVQRDDLILRRHRLPDVADVLRDGSKAFLNNGGKE